MTEAQEQRRMAEYHEFLKAKRSEVADPLATLALGATFGALGVRAEVPRFAEVTPSYERQVMEQKTIPRMTHIALSDTIELRRPVVSAPLDSRALEGYALAA